MTKKHIFDFNKFILNNNLTKKKFVVGYSGGLDSTVLLYDLYLYKKEYKNISIRAIHINHSINKESKSWVQHCNEQCKKYKINLTIIHLKKNVCNFFKKQYGGLESSARNIRYKIFNKYVFKDEILLIAHHLQDQVETFFLNLKRSSGPSGLSGMQTKKKIYNMIICRPMLEISKKQIYFFALKNKLSWIIDPSNKDCNLERNYIREKLLPILQHKWPYFEKAIMKTTLLCSFQEKLLVKYLNKELIYLINIKNDSLYYLPLLNMSKYKQYYILRGWIKKILPNITPNYNFLLHILKNVINTKRDSHPKLKFNNYEIIKYKNYIYLINYIKQSNLINVLIKGKLPWKKIILPYKLGSIIQVNKENLLSSLIRKPLNNEKIYIKFGINNALNNKYNLNKILKKKYIPYWLRNRIPLIFYNNNFICAINYFVSHESIDVYKNDNFCLRWRAPKYFKK